MTDGPTAGSSRRPVHSAEAFSKDLRASFDSVRGTLLHILWGEWGWLRYWQDGTFIPEFPLEDFATVAALEASWSELEQAQRAFVAGLTDEALSGQGAVDEYTYTLGELSTIPSITPPTTEARWSCSSASLGTHLRRRTSGSSSRRHGTGLPSARPQRKQLTGSPRSSMRRCSSHISLCSRLPPRPRSTYGRISERNQRPKESRNESPSNAVELGVGVDVAPFVSDGDKMTAINFVERGGSLKVGHATQRLV
jgi:hypothetical protein